MLGTVGRRFESYLGDHRQVAQWESNSKLIVWPFKCFNLADATDFDRQNKNFFKNIC